jgi:hypothetical protein
MTATTNGSTGIARQPATGVFEHAAGLLASAQALEAAARTPGAEAAIGPMLACLELTFDALVHAVGQMRGHALESFARSGTDRDIRLASAEAEQRFGALAAVLDDCRDACILARRSSALG